MSVFVFIALAVASGTTLGNVVSDVIAGALASWQRRRRDGAMLALKARINEKRRSQVGGESSLLANRRDAAGSEMGVPKP